MRNHQVPDSLLAAEREFSQRLRDSQHDGRMDSSGVQIYRKVVRENVISVLRSVFPLYCKDFTSAEFSEFADAFIMQHQATEPEFHQLATELLLFMRQHPERLEADDQVIEYEWLVYALEIDQSVVSAPQTIAPESREMHKMTIELNPTLKMVALPFLLKDGEPYYEKDRPEHYYALYRRYDNMLYQKKLNIADVQLLLEAGHAGITVEMLKKKSASHAITPSFDEWLAVNNKDEVLSLII